MDMRFNWNNPVSVMAYERTGGEQGRLFLANEAKRLMDPYVPAQNLVLAQNTRIYTEDDGAVVEYNSPYAHYQYEGVLYVSSATGSAWARSGEFKVKAEPEKKLVQSKFRHPLASSHWDDAMMTVRKGDLTKAFQRYLQRQGGG